VTDAAKPPIAPAPAQPRQVTMPVERVLAEVEAQRNQLMTQMAVANAMVGAISAELDTANARIAELERENAALKKGRK